MLILRLFAHQSAKWIYSVFH